LFLCLLGSKYVEFTLCFFVCSATPFQIRTNKLPAHLLADDRVIMLEKKCTKLESDAVASKEELLKSQHEWNDVCTLRFDVQFIVIFSFLV
jgi:hypothetical protein